MTPELLAAAEPRMDEVAARRARHVVEEDLRVHEAELALAAGDLAEVGRLFAASHASLRDLYEVSSPELDALVEIATAVPGVVGGPSDRRRLRRLDRQPRPPRGRRRPPGRRRARLPGADRPDADRAGRGRRQRGVVGPPAGFVRPAGPVELLRPPRARTGATRSRRMPAASKRSTSKSSPLACRSSPRRVSALARETASSLAGQTEIR